MKKGIITALLFAICILFALLASCAESSQKDNDPQNTNLSAENSETETETDARQAILNLYKAPNADYNGDEFKMQLRQFSNDSWGSSDVIIEEESGDVVDDAIYMRNLEVETALNIKLIPIYVNYDSQVKSLRTSIMSGDGAFDTVFTSFQNGFEMANAGYLTNFAEVSGIDIFMPWWDQNLIKETSVMNKVYYMTGDIVTFDKRGTWTMMFNKDLHKKYDLPDIYEIVKNGDWTIEKLAELCKGVTMDLNGDGKLDKGDQVGVATTYDCIRSFFFATGLRIIKKDAADLPYFALENEQAITNLEKVYNLFRSANDIVMFANEHGDWSTTRDAFLENRALFYAEVMNYVQNLRSMETDFGVIPLPKANALQDGYYTNIHLMASEAVMIPFGTDDNTAERAGTVLEAMGYGGYKHIRPAYYEVSLKTKFARDDDSSDMIGLILLGRSADLGYIGKIGGLLESLVSNIASRNNAFASTIESNSPKVYSEIEKLIEIYNELP